MKPALSLFIMIDACGWEIVKDEPFLAKLAPNRKRLQSVFGYSSACVPSILSGRWPAEHRNWCYFVYDPRNSPFKSLAFLSWIPRRIANRRFVRRWVSKFVGRALGFKGYFDLYNIPLDRIGSYDFSEKRSPLRPGGMNCGPNICDLLETESIPYLISDPSKSEEANTEKLAMEIEKESIDFAFSYWPDFDGLLHRVGNQSPQIKTRLWGYERRIEGLLEAAKGHYETVSLHVFSDHGMANCDELLDLQSIIGALDTMEGPDYAVVYDSTMARFWFHNDDAREKIKKCLGTVPQGRILPDEELKRLGAYFPDHYFGELIYLLKEGVLIVPSHMGERPIRAMHGYHPDEKHSFAALFSNQEIPADISAIPHIYNLMAAGARMAKKANSEALAPQRH